MTPDSPLVGTELTAMLTDQDMPTNTTWQWLSSDAMDSGFTAIDGATMYTYTPVEADANMYVRAMATYTDAHGDQEESSAAVMVRPATPVAMYDTNGTPGIQIDELFSAIDAYFDGEITDISDLFEIINAYFEANG